MSAFAIQETRQDDLHILRSNVQDLIVSYIEAINSEPSSPDNLSLLNHLQEILGKLPEANEEKLSATLSWLQSEQNLSESASEEEEKDKKEEKTTPPTQQTQKNNPFKEIAFNIIYDMGFFFYPGSFPKILDYIAEVSWLVNDQELKDENDLMNVKNGFRADMHALTYAPTASDAKDEAQLFKKAKALIIELTLQQNDPHQKKIFFQEQFTLLVAATEQLQSSQNLGPIQELLARLEQQINAHKPATAGISAPTAECKDECKNEASPTIIPPPPSEAATRDSTCSPQHAPPTVPPKRRFSFVYAAFFSLPHEDNSNPSSSFTSQPPSLSPRQGSGSGTS